MYGGFGSYVTGGAYGRIVRVTTLDSGGVGSLRWACEARDDQRIIVFDVAGVIDLAGNDIEIQGNNVSLWGDTAPPGGVEVRGGTLIISSRNVIVRHLRVRHGDNKVGDTLTITPSAVGFVIDHCSLYWSVDETLSVAGQDGTVSWCILAQPLHDSIHPKGPHAFCCMTHNRGTRVTWHHNLIAHATVRVPAFYAGHNQAINNVIYNSVWPPSFLPSDAPVHLDYINNMRISGPNAEPGDNRNCGLRCTPDAGWDESSLYVAGNIDTLRMSDDQPDTMSLYSEDSYVDVLIDTPHGFPPVAHSSATRAYSEVLAGAGAQRPERDTTDRQLVEAVQQRTGTLVNVPNFRPITSRSRIERLYTTSSSNYLHGVDFAYRGQYDQQPLFFVRGDSLDILSMDDDGRFSRVT